MSKTHKVGAIHGTEEIILSLRTISTAEEKKFTTQFTNISDSDSEERKSEQEYDILVDRLADWSVEKPVIKINGKEQDVPGDTPADAVRAYFAERTPEKDRTANAVVVYFRRKLQPEVVFY